MLYDVKCRTFEPITRRPHIEIVQVDADGGDDAAAKAHAIKPGCHVVGINPTDMKALRDAERKPPALQGADDPDYSQDRPSARDLAEKRGPGRPRKVAV